MKLSKILSVAAMAGSMVGLSALAADMSSKPVSATGWITDAKCGAKMASAAGAACAKKCIAGGEKPVFVDSATQAVWAIDNPESVADHAGHNVKVKATEDASTKTMHITKVSMVAAKGTSDSSMGSMK
ncbi:MAG: hypothetical protein ACYCSN_15525 [Acidobacteriaceae bacterium]